MIDEIKINYGHIFEKELLQEINNVCVIKDVPEGFIFIEIGEYAKSMPLLFSGAIKILRQDDDGNELLLYFLEKGDTCAMTLSCCIGRSKSEIRAVAVVDTKLIVIPIQKMEEWTSKYKTWRNFVFKSYHNRLMELLETIDNIAFLKMDERLLKYLFDKVKVTNNSIINSTHQQIAYDLNTSRVVVSRLLKTLENKKIIKLHRNKIELIDSK